MAIARTEDRQGTQVWYATAMLLEGSVCEEFSVDRPIAV